MWNIVFFWTSQEYCCSTEKNKTKSRFGRSIRKKKKVEEDQSNRYCQMSCIVLLVCRSRVEIDQSFFPKIKMKRKEKETSLHGSYSNQTVCNNAWKSVRKSVENSFCFSFLFSSGSIRRNRSRKKRFFLFFSLRLSSFFSHRHHQEIIHLEIFFHCHSIRTIQWTFFSLFTLENDIRDQ